MDRLVTALHLLGQISNNHFGACSGVFNPNSENIKTYIMLASVLAALNRRFIQQTETEANFVFL